MLPSFRAISEYITSAVFGLLSTAFSATETGSIPIEDKSVTPCALRMRFELRIKRSHIRFGFRRVSCALAGVARVKIRAAAAAVTSFFILRYVSGMTLFKGLKGSSQQILSVDLLSILYKTQNSSPSNLSSRAGGLYTKLRQELLTGAAKVKTQTI